MVGIDGDVFTIRLMFFALLVNGLTIIVVDGITTLVTVALECVPLTFTLFWLMLLPGMADVIAILRLLADVIAMWLMLLPLFVYLIGWCYCLVADVITTIVVMLADVTALEADGIAYCGCGWQME